MTIIFYTVAIALAGYTGYKDYEWYFIVISALLFSLGWVFDRLGTIPLLLEKTSIFNLMFNQIIIYSTGNQTVHYYNVTCNLLGKWSNFWYFGEK